ncbi:hypothetical protein ACRAWF_06065 [Streptomyces sp. L7]
MTPFALRGVAIEPLGVVRKAKPLRRRLWWRLPMPLARASRCSYPMIGQRQQQRELQPVAGDRRHGPAARRHHRPAAVGSSRPPWPG